jgi:hypothetical protein
MNRDLQMTVEVQDIGIGMLVDLENDPYADPEHRAHIAPYELSRVEDWEIETEDCIVIHFSNTSIGFPREHKLTRVVRLDEPS